jgi:hypothetical protein
MNRFTPLLGHLRPAPASHAETAEDRRLAPSADGPTLRVAMIGAGRYANTWARAYATSERCQIVAVCDPDDENCAVTAARFGCAGYSSWDEMFANHEIDIAAPILHVSSNPAAVVAAAAAGVKAVCASPPCLPFPQSPPRDLPAGPPPPPSPLPRAAPIRLPIPLLLLRAHPLPPGVATARPRRQREAAGIHATRRGPHGFRV